MTRLTRVLVAVPDGAARVRLAEALVGSGMRISGVARTAPQATVLANRLSPDVVVASAQLPGGLYRLVRYLADELGIPTVVLTPFPQEAALAAHDSDVLPAVRSGATAFVEEGRSTWSTSSSGWSWERRCCPDTTWPWSSRSSGRWSWRPSAAAGVRRSG